MTHIQPDEIKIKILERRLEEVWVEGDRLQATTFIQDEELLQQLLRLEEATQKLEAIKKALDNPDYAFLGLEYTQARIRDILEPTIDSDTIGTMQYTCGNCGCVNTSLNKVKGKCTCNQCGHTWGTIDSDKERLT